MEWPDTVLDHGKIILPESYISCSTAGTNRGTWAIISGKRLCAFALHTTQTLYNTKSELVDSNEKAMMKRKAIIL